MGQLKLLLISLLMPILSFSQSGYPKQILLEGDSIVAITKDQMKTLNLVKVTLDKNIEMNKLKDLKIVSLENTIKADTQLIGQLDKAEEVNKALLNNRQELIASQAKTIDNLSNIIKKDKVKKGVLISLIVGGIIAIILK